MSELKDRLEQIRVSLRASSIERHSDTIQHQIDSIKEFAKEIRKRQLHSTDMPEDCIDDILKELGIEL